MEGHDEELHLLPRPLAWSTTVRSGDPPGGSLLGAGKSRYSLMHRSSKHPGWSAWDRDSIHVFDLEDGRLARQNLDQEPRIPPPPAAAEFALEGAIVISHLRRMALNRARRIGAENAHQPRSGREMVFCDG